MIKDNFITVSADSEPPSLCKNIINFYLNNEDPSIGNRVFFNF